LESRVVELLEVEKLRNKRGVRVELVSEIRE
jgi:hypothetical protein